MRPGIYGASLRIDGQPHEHNFFHRGRHCVPVRLPGGGRSLQFGRTSAPIYLAKIGLVPSPLWHPYT
jgi:hypothetical protein